MLSRQTPAWWSVMVALLAAASSLYTGIAAHAEVIRFEIENRVPAFEGRTFGEAGAYDLVKARAYGEVDANDWRNAVIADIDLAPKNDRGRVEYSTEVQILRPVDPSRGNHRLFYEVLNRGNKLSVRDFNDPHQTTTCRPKNKIELLFAPADMRASDATAAITRNCC
jgi:hypothetical protein